MNPLLHNLMIAQSPPGEGDSILPLIVWAIIGAFWLFAQISQKKKDYDRLRRQGKPLNRPAIDVEGRQTRPSRTREARNQPRANVEDEMRAFLEQLTGNAPQPEPPEPPPAPVAPTPPPIPRRPEPTIEFDDNAEVPTASLNDSQNRIKELRDIDESIYEIDDLNVYKEADKIIDIADLERELENEALHATQALVNVRTFITKLDTLTVPIMRTEMLSMRPVCTKTSRPNLTQRKAFRQAVVGRIILSPCKALEDDIFKTDQGAL